MGNSVLPYFDVECGYYNADFHMDTWYSDRYRGRVYIKCWEGTSVLCVL